MTVVTSIHTVRDPRHVRAWLRTVAINAARSAGRSKRPVVSGSADDCFEFVAAAGNADADRSNDEIRRMLMLAMQLPDHYREPLMLRAVRGLSSRQVGDILDLPPATVDTRVCRARRMLRELVEQEQWDDGDGGRRDCGGEGSDPSSMTDSETSERRRVGTPGAAR